MDNLLTDRQAAILQYIKDTISNTGYPPSVREIGQAVGLKSTSTVHAHLLQLEQKGYLKRDPIKTRAIIPIDCSETDNFNSHSISLPVIGSVAAGTPILAEQNIEYYIPVPEDLIGRGNFFVLKVKGESMIEAGILNGDYLIVREQSQASNGEIVVALLDGEEATVKRFYQHSDHIELRPENSSMQPIITDDVQIVGKVSGLIRKM